MKKLLSALLLLAMMFACVSCGSEPAETVDPTPAETTEGAETEDKTIKIVFVTAELGDHSFADNSDLSLQGIAKDYPSVEYSCSQVGADGLVNGVREAAQNGADIVVFGSDVEVDAMVGEEGKDYPNTIFYEYGVSNTWEPKSDNPLCANFAACHSSYLGGIVANSVSQSKVCAYIGGQESIGLYEWMIGYVQGVYNTNGTTAYSWVAGSSPWSDPAKAKELSTALYNNYGADVFWGCAGQSGDGCFMAAIDLREKTGRDDIWGIGVDADQHAVFASADKEDLAEVVLTSCVQNCCEPLRGVVETLLAGEKVECGLHTYGIQDYNACGIAENDFFKANVSQETLDAVNKAKEQIISGEIEVVSAWGMTNADLDAFLEPRCINYQQVQA